MKIVPNKLVLKYFGKKNFSMDEKLFNKKKIITKNFQTKPNHIE